MPTRQHLKPLRSAQHRASLKGLRMSLKGAEDHHDLLFDLNDCADFHGRELEETSKFMKPGAQRNIPKFATQEVVVGELLGSGGYNLIFALDAISLRDDSERRENDGPVVVPTRRSTPADNEQLQRLAFATMANHGKQSSNHQYVVKFLDPDLQQKRLKSGALDLVKEAKMLSNLQHENIISLRGLAEEKGAGFAEGTTGYFLILDRLEETLLQRINRWKLAHSFNPLRHIFKKKRMSVADGAKGGFWERFQVLVELASPLVYLHSLDVCFRDNKPENIGFSRQDGTLKLFDFGLAKELNKCPRVSPTSTLYHVGSFGGTHPYLAPEVAMAQPYGLSADTYSFAIICYEVLTMREPFGDLMEHEYENKVIQGDRRPKLPKNWSPELKELLSQCWDANPESRPPMEQVCVRLQEIQQQHSFAM